MESQAVVMSPSESSEVTPAEQTIAGAKYIALVMEIGAKLEYATGWRGEVARRLGVSLSLISQILNGRKVTQTTLQKAIETAGLPPDYFGAEGLAQRPITTPPPPRLMTSHHHPLKSDSGMFMVPKATTTAPDPLLVLVAYRALPLDVRARLRTMLDVIDAEAARGG
jgi:transcriptional regulator with XRE-family HTH domain